MPAPNLICLVIDRLHAGYLGAYGNAWIHTPSIDRLATQSFLFQRAMIDSPNPETIYRSLWTGLHAMCPREREAGREPLPAALARAGWQTTLLTDDEIVARHPLAGSFAASVLVPHADPRATVADSIDDTDAAAFFAAASETIPKLKHPFALWLHTGTLARVWDAPLEYRRQYIDEEDPDVGDWATPPERELPENFDPDERVAIAHAYAGQVTLLDEMIGSILTAVDEAGLGADTAFVLTSARGYPLGEHRGVGALADALYAELTRVPLLLRLPDQLGAADRSDALVQPHDLAATILDLGGLTPGAGRPVAGEGRSLLPLIRGEFPPGFDRVFAASTAERRIETPAWALRLSQAAGADPDRSQSTLETALRSELFVKPDDWFELNEVSSRAEEVLPQLRSVLDQFEKSCETGEPEALADLSAELVFGTD